MDTAVPEPFKLLSMSPDNGFVQANGPLYGRMDGERFVLGLRVEQRHCNPAGTCHGGMLALLADMLLITGSNIQARLSRYLLTVSLNCDFIGPAPRGSWIEGRAEVLRATKTLLFAQGLLTADGAPVLRTNGTFRLPAHADPRYGPERYGL